MSLLGQSPKHYTVTVVEGDVFDEQHQYVIRSNMQFRAGLRPSTNPVQSSHEDRVKCPALASAWWLHWSQVTATVRPFLPPCCGCGQPTTTRCSCARSYWCERCNEADFAMFFEGKCRRCTNEAHQREFRRSGPLNPLTPDQAFLPELLRVMEASSAATLAPYIPTLED